MACISPIVVKLPTGLLQEVGCGQCRTCRLRRKLGWVGRLTLESLDHEFSRFVTLTYAKAPEVLDYRDFQLFMKRYREEKGAARFFVVGEYGGLNGRGHYHAILFGHAAERYGYNVSLSKMWGLGGCDDKPLTPGRIAYCAGYCFKDNYREGKVPFVRMSLKPGIGMERIAAMGKAAAARVRLSAWPTSYNIGRKHYPLCDGGLAKFQSEYLENGGLPPPICNPMERDFAARNRHILGGAQVFENKQILENLKARYRDGSAIKAQR